MTPDAAVDPDAAVAVDPDAIARALKAVDPVAIARARERSPSFSDIFSAFRAMKPDDRLGKDASPADAATALKAVKPDDIARTFEKEGDPNGALSFSAIARVLKEVDTTAIARALKDNPNAALSFEAIARILKGGNTPAEIASILEAVNLGDIISVFEAADHAAARSLAAIARALKAASPDAIARALKAATPDAIARALKDNPNAALSFEAIVSALEAINARSRGDVEPDAIAHAFEGPIASTLQEVEPDAIARAFEDAGDRNGALSFSAIARTFKGVNPVAIARALKDNPNAASSFDATVRVLNAASAEEIVRIIKEEAINLDDIICVFDDAAAGYTADQAAAAARFLAAIARALNEV